MSEWVGKYHRTSCTIAKFQVTHYRWTCTLLPEECKLVQLINNNTAQMNYISACVYMYMYIRACVNLHVHVATLYI